MTYRIAVENGDRSPRLQVYRSESMARARPSGGGRGEGKAHRVGCAGGVFPNDVSSRDPTPVSRRIRSNVRVAHTAYWADPVLVTQGAAATHEGMRARPGPTGKRRPRVVTLDHVSDHLSTSVETPLASTGIRSVVFNRPGHPRSISRTPSHWRSPNRACAEGRDRHGADEADASRRGLVIQVPSYLEARTLVIVDTRDGRSPAARGADTPCALRRRHVWRWRHTDACPWLASMP